jgi:hypothetical protein
MARDIAGDAASVGVPLPGDAVRVPLLETGHQPNIPGDRAPNSSTALGPFQP